MLNHQERISALSHVLWISGSPCAGKSSIGYTIARTHVFLDYHFDPMERRFVYGSDAMAEGAPFVE